MYLYVGVGLIFVSVLYLVYAVNRQASLAQSSSDKTKTHNGPTAPELLSTAQVAELEAKLKQAYEHQIETASAHLGEELKATSARLNEQVVRLTTNVIEAELEGYQKTLEEVRKVSNETMKQLYHSVEEQRVELRKTMEQELAEERQQLISRFDTRMGEIVASYITESLGGGVDLGSQMTYITETLDANKAALKKNLSSGL